MKTVEQLFAEADECRDWKVTTDMLKTYIEDQRFVIKWLLQTHVKSYKKGDCYRLPNGDCIGVECAHRFDYED